MQDDREVMEQLGRELEYFRKYEMKGKDVRDDGYCSISTGYLSYCTIKVMVYVQMHKCMDWCHQ